MLEELFPRVHRCYSTLPVLGSTLDGFAEFLINQGYPPAPVRRHIRTALRVDVKLRRRGCRVLRKITRAELRTCAPPPGRSKDDADLAATIRLLERYLDGKKILPPLGPPSPTQRMLDDYAAWLRQVRGLAASTIKHHLWTVSQFIAQPDGYRGFPLLRLTSREVEDFVRRAGSRVSRATLQQVVSALRSFLRFLATRGHAPSGLDTQIDTPRVYRGEQLPRALPWETVRALVRSIDRSTPIGLRDYAMFLLITTYGLRASEVVALKLQDIEWRAGGLRVSQRKTSAPLLLPLTDAIGESLAAYLRRGRPDAPCREVFVRHRAPAGVLKPTAVTEAFQAWSKRSGLEIKFHGPHCLRHSYAVHLLRQGTSLKTIGDVLGHRNAESTCVYLRLAVEDLRGVALELPASSSQQVRP